MAFYTRAMETICRSASEQFPVVLLTGPRQVGKTSLLQHLAERVRRYVTLDDPAARALAKQDPGLFLQRFEPPVLIDEIQYAPELLPLIKIAVDRSRARGQFWLAGSQQFKLMRGISESLAGRVAVLSLLGFSSRERHRLALDLPPFHPSPGALEPRARDARPLSLARAYRDIWLGSFPALAAGEVRDRDLFYSSYLQTYLQRDVRDLAQVGNEAAFLRFLRACAARTAQLLNVTELARDADVAVNTAKAWLSILQTSFQVILLPPYHTNLTKRLVKTPKLHFVDTGLCAYLTQWSTPETLEAGAMSGAILETYVVGEVLRSWWGAGKEPQLFYYRDKDGNEIDLLLMIERRFHPLEVKKSSSPGRDSIRAFAALDRLKPGWAWGGVVGFARELLPITDKTFAIPLGII